MARPEGFEPPTSWFEAKRSIRLSYGRAVSETIERRDALRLRELHASIDGSVAHVQEPRAGIRDVARWPVSGEPGWTPGAEKS